MTRALARRTIFDVLPPEIIFHILDTLHPNLYTGFLCASRQALAVTNAKLRPELHGVHSGYKTVCPHYESITGRFAYYWRHQDHWTERDPEL